MAEAAEARERLGIVRAAWIVGAAGLAIGLALGGASRLSYHEAIGAQAAREMVASGDWLVPTLGGRPWLEKPPGPIWFVAGLGALAGRIDEATARLPGLLAGVGVALAVACLASRRFGPRVGLLAGLAQAGMVWLVERSRLAEADILLACVLAWGLLAFDRVRRGAAERPEGWGRWRLAFFGLMGATALFKGVGFGGVLAGATVLTLLVLDRDRATARALLWPTGWVLAAGVALAWPLAVLGRHPEALGLWTTHITDRLADQPEHFAGEPWWQYAPAPLFLVLPWTPMALGGAWRSGRRALAGDGRGGPDRLLWAWAVVPAALVSLASTRNAHYLIHALPPWAVWAGLGLDRLGGRLRAWGLSEPRLRRWAALGFAGVALAWGLGFALLGPTLDRRGKGAEWAFYQRASLALAAGEPVVLLYDAMDHPDRWDRLPYPTPFGPVPPDLAARLFYLDRPGVTWRFGLSASEPPGGPVVVVARERDRPALAGLGRVSVVAEGPRSRWDRAFDLYRVEPDPEPARLGARRLPESPGR